MDVNDIKVVKSFIKDLNDTGTVSRGDVKSLELSIENIVSDELPVNMFTTMKTSTGVVELAKHLENIISNEEVETNVSIIDLIKTIETINGRVDEIDSMFKKAGNEIDVELFNSCMKDHFVSYYQGDELINPFEFNVMEFINILGHIEENLISNKSTEVARNIATYTSRIQSLLDNKTLQTFSLLNNLMADNLTLSPSTKTVDYTIGDVVKKLLVEDGFRSALIKVRKSLKDRLNGLLFDSRYDLNMNDTEYNFTYNYTEKDLKNLESILDDDVSLMVISILYAYFAK